MNRKLLRLTGGGLILLGSSLVVAGMILAVLPDSYQATVRVRVGQDSRDLITSSPTNGPIAFDPYWLQRQFEVLQSKPILYRVITNLNLTRRRAEAFPAKAGLRLDVAYTRLKKQIEVRGVRCTSLAQIRVWSADKDEAVAIANGIADVYRDWRIERRNEARIGRPPLTAELEKLDQAIINKHAEMEAVQAPSQANGAEARALEELEQKRALLKLQILQEEADNSGHGPVRIVDLAERPLGPLYPRRTLAIAALLAGVGAIILGAVLLRTCGSRLEF